MRYYFIPITYITPGYFSVQIKVFNAIFFKQILISN
jgi:hypothetical protein